MEDGVGIVVGVLAFLAGLVFGPLLTLWCINTLFIGPMGGHLLRYELFTWEYWAVFIPAVIVAVGALMGGAAKKQ